MQYYFMVATRHSRSWSKRVGEWTRCCLGSVIVGIQISKYWCDNTFENIKLVNFSFFLNYDVSLYSIIYRQRDLEPLHCHLSLNSDTITYWLVALSKLPVSVFLRLIIYKMDLKKKRKQKKHYLFH